MGTALACEEALARPGFRAGHGRAERRQVLRDDAASRSALQKRARSGTGVPQEPHAVGFVSGMRRDYMVPGSVRPVRGPDATVSVRPASGQPDLPPAPPVSRRASRPPRDSARRLDGDLLDGLAPAGRDRLVRERDAVDRDGSPRRRSSPRPVRSGPSPCVRCGSRNPSSGRRPSAPAVPSTLTCSTWPSISPTFSVPFAATTTLGSSPRRDDGQRLTVERGQVLVPHRGRQILALARQST